MLKDKVLRMDNIYYFLNQELCFLTNKFLEEPGTFWFKQELLGKTKKKALSYWFTKINSK